MSPSKKKLRGDDGGLSMFRFVAELHSACQASSGGAVRGTLDLLKGYVPIVVHEVQSGTRLLDWIVPPEWKVRNAYIRCRREGRVVSVTSPQLQVVGYSCPVRATISREQLRRHIFAVSECTDWIPDRKWKDHRRWGFCLTPEQLQGVQGENEYEVYIDSRLEAGHLTYGEYLLRGRSLDEVLISCQLRAPCRCDDNLSGVAVATALAQGLSAHKTRYSYRFLFVPSMVGPVAWLVLNQPRLFRIKHGLVLTQLGGAGLPAYKRSRRGDAEIDRAFAFVLNATGQEFKVEPFSPCGHDERQYCAPGLDLPVGRFMRSPPAAIARSSQMPMLGLDEVGAEHLAASLTHLLSVVDVLEHNRCWLNQSPLCEPQLSRYGLPWPDATDEHRRAVAWLLSCGDGTNTMLDIAIRADLHWNVIKRAARALTECGLLKSAGRRNQRSRTIVRAAPT